MCQKQTRAKTRYSHTWAIFCWHSLLNRRSSRNFLALTASIRTPHASHTAMTAPRKSASTVIRLSKPVSSCLQAFVGNSERRRRHFVGQTVRVCDISFIFVEFRLVESSLSGSSSPSSPSPTIDRSESRSRWALRRLFSVSYWSAPLRRRECLLFCRVIFAFTAQLLLFLGGTPTTSALCRS